MDDGTIVMGPQFFLSTTPARWILKVIRSNLHVTVIIRIICNTSQQLNNTVKPVTAINEH